MRSRTVLAPPHPSAVLQKVDRKGMWGCNRTVTQMPTITRTRTKTSLPFLHVPASETSQLFPPPPSQPHTPALLGAGGGAPLGAMPHTPAPGSAGGGARRRMVASPTCKGRKCCFFFFVAGGVVCVPFIYCLAWLFGLYEPDCGSGLYRIYVGEMFRLLVSFSVGPSVW